MLHTDGVQQFDRIEVFFTLYYVILPKFCSGDEFILITNHQESQIFISNYELHHRQYVDCPQKHMPAHPLYRAAASYIFSYLTPGWISVAKVTVEIRHKLHIQN